MSCWRMSDSKAAAAAKRARIVIYDPLVEGFLGLEPLLLDELGEELGLVDGLEVRPELSIVPVEGPVAVG